MKHNLVVLAAVGVLVATAATIAASLRSGAKWDISHATFAALALTLVVLLFYTAYTREMATVAAAEWRRNSILGTTPYMRMADPSPGSDRVLFGFSNPTTLNVRAKVWCNCRVYGHPVDYHPDFDGTNTWHLWPLEVAQGWFEVSKLLAGQGKSAADMIAEATDANRHYQLTMDLRVEARDAPPPI